MNITPLIITENRLTSNPAILRLKNKLELFINAKAEEKENLKNNVLISYANSILSFSIQAISYKYGKNVNLHISKFILPVEWELMRTYK